MVQVLKIPTRISSFVDTNLKKKKPKKTHFQQSLVNVVLQLVSGGGVVSADLVATPD